MRILMTGATAGIGLQATLRLIDLPDADLTIGARSPAAAPRAFRERATIVPLDLSSLVSVRDFAEAARARGPFDVLVLNAGVQCVSRRMSADGFELTFAVNHLAHYLLARLLAPELREGGRVVFTASGKHDPEERTPIPVPRHADAGRLAFPDTDPDLDRDAGRAGRRAYSTSKLCNVLTARELVRRLAPTRPDIAVAAFDPGFTPGTGLARDYPGVAGFIFKRLMPLVVRAGPSVSTPAISGRLLADLATGADYAGTRGGYFAVKGPRMVEKPPSLLARDDAVAASLWEDSAPLVGLASAAAAVQG